MIKIVIIGRTPPPIGGVTIHVHRLLGWLKQEGHSVRFYDMSSFKVSSLVSTIRKNDVLHLNLSNSYFSLLLTILAKLFGKNVIATYHGNVGRWTMARNLVDRLCLSLIDFPLVLNEKSLITVKKWNGNVRQISAFLPPIDDNVLEDELEERVSNFCKGGELVYCSNAFTLAYDTNGEETYGITQLVRLFSELDGKRLILSDPSGAYGLHYENLGDRLAENILLISQPHSFYAIIKKCDFMIRATTTDGDSLSVREALYLGIPVIASDCVSRPEGVISYAAGDYPSLEKTIKNPTKRIPHKRKITHGFHDIKSLYNLINKNQ